MTREEAKAVLYEWQKSMVGHGVPIDTSKVQALRVAIEALQTDVVRCKDCKHWYADADAGMACEFTNMGQPEDGYCNWGERKGGDPE